MDLCCNPPAHFDLEETILQLHALLEMSINLHHYATLHEGHNLSDGAVAGLISLRSRLEADSNSQLAGTFALVRSPRTKRN